MSIELEKRLLVDQEAVLHAGSWGGEPARLWMIDPAGAGPAAVEAAQRDMESLGALDEAALLPITANGQLDDGRLWAAVPPEPDLGLHELLEELGPLRLPQLRALARALCAALTALHQQGIVHGGLAPSMMRYTSIHDDDAPPRLTGAGWCSLRLVWLAHAEPDPEIIRRMAPELHQGVKVLTDRQADIFATGCLLYEAATGRPAFAGDSNDQVLAALSSADRPDIREVLGAAEEPLARVLGRCLCVSPKDRYPSVTALWRELAPALGDAANPLNAHHTGPIGLPAEAASTAESAPSGNGQAQPAVIVDKDQARQRRGSGLLTLGVTVGAAVLAVVILLVLRGRSDKGSQGGLGNDGAMANAMGTSSMAGAHDRTRPHHRSLGVPPRVRPKPGTEKINRLLARVGLTGGEVVVDHALELDYDLAVQALHDGKPKAFAEALQQIKRATRRKRCASFWKKKQFYIKSGLRTLGKRIGHWERFRIERRLADVQKSGGGCKARNRRLTPLVEEMRDRLVDKRVK